MRWRVACIVLCVCLLAICALRWFPDWFLPPLAYWLDVGEQPAQADYVLVLPGDYNTRPFVAAALVKNGLARTVLVLQDVPSPVVEEGILLPDDEIVREVLRHRGVGDDQIMTLAGRTGNTFEDAALLGSFLQRKPNALVTVVTTAYHTRRARWTFRHGLGPRMKQVVFVSAPNDLFDAEQWWRYEDGVAAVGSEYVKLAAYGISYGSLAYWLSAGAVGVFVLTGWRYWSRTRRRDKAAMA